MKLRGVVTMEWDVDPEEYGECEDVLEVEEARDPMEILEQVSFCDFHVTEALES